MLNRSNKVLRLRTRPSGRLVFSLLFLITIQVGCKKLIEIPAPVTSISSANVFSNDATAAAVLTGIYTNMSSSNSGWSGINSMFLYVALSADELALYDNNNVAYLPYYSNALSNSNTGGADYWNTIYPMIFVANSATEGLSNGSGLTPAVRQQLMGEAKFIRAFCYFYLINLYGDVPLVTGTDYTVNTVLPRTPKAQVWQQVINDLKDAQNLLSTNYLDATLLNTTTERVRPTSWAATALLARAYLYTQKWDSAEAQATAIINNSTLYSLDTLNGVFLKNNPEAIWQLQPVGTDVNSNTGEGALFILDPIAGPNTSGTHPVYLSNYVVNSFEPGDQRRSNWVDSVTVGNTTYYYPYKYKIGLINTPAAEYSTVFRLGEQYLIRAEARAQRSNITGASADLDTIRSRAGLAGTSASTQIDLLTAIQHERRVELFTEWGHRWLDMKRTGTVDAVMGSGGVCATKGGTWNIDWQWYPIPLSELQADPNLKQNKGY
ncbi:MAG TPA: RagB/SusD family nutrient uptake outer membrane protein [Puia sp.]|nr:RagB/SusD family nutrient uptake outer membrane protein [Puia sp.]